MLQGDFFTFTITQNEAFVIKADLQINAGHKIFEGHFPGQPVVPGVCMMQMIKEIIEKVVERETNLLNADEMKFLTIINPTENSLVLAELKYSAVENNGIRVVASLTNNAGVVYFRFKGTFV